MSYSINTTEEYHRSSLETLGWELTLCNMLQDPSSPCRRVLKNPMSFGMALDAHLKRHVPAGFRNRVLETGGGYGNLMADLVKLNPGIKPVMLDIAPVLLDRQRKALSGTDAEFIEADFFTVEDAFLSEFDLAIFNENLGDFPTVCGIDRSIAEGKHTPGSDGVMDEVITMHKRYELAMPTGPFFNFNLGAMRAVEKLCRAGVPAFYLSEHSCEAPGTGSERPGGNPEPIRLKGHTEYTVRFSHLESVASHYGYRVTRGLYADFLEIDYTPEVQFILRSEASAKDDYEIIRQFIGDLHTYEYIICVKG